MVLFSSPVWGGGSPTKSYDSSTKSYDSSGGYYPEFWLHLVPSQGINTTFNFTGLPMDRRYVNIGSTFFYFFHFPSSILLVP